MPTYLTVALALAWTTGVALALAWTTGVALALAWTTGVALALASYRTGARPGREPGARGPPYAP